MGKVTVSLIKADVGSVAGHTTPHPKMIEAVKSVLSDGTKKGIIEDFATARCGDDISLIMTHDKGENNEKVHKLAWDAFMSAAEEAKKMHLYGAGQDLLAEAFSGNVRGLGPGAAEMTFEERKSEPVIALLADKTEPSAFNLPLARIFADPFTTTGLVIDTRMHAGFIFEVVDVKEHKKIKISTPEGLHDLLAFIGDITRYAIKRIFSKDNSIGIAAVVSTEKLSLIAGKYVGKDDPVALIRAQSGLPAAGEVLQPFAFPALVSGWMRGSHWGPFYPSSQDDSNPTFFDGPPRIVALGFHVRDGKIQGLEDASKPGEHILLDYFKDSSWDAVRRQAMEVAIYIRRHGPFMPAILPPEELEYTTLPEVRKKLQDKWEEVD
ncbi:Fructose-1,6-bisphosphate aldolase/phosphatase [bacterium HR19]|nr:Fructose-1,6-bisphosphate aldolase/phosphatase [bacterium HR19]